MIRWFCSGQGYHGTTAAGKFYIQGIFHYPLEQLNNNLVFLSLPEAGILFGAPGMLTSTSMMLDHTENVSTIPLMLSVLHCPQTWK